MPEQKFPERNSGLSDFPDAETGVEAKDPTDTDESPLISDSDKSKSTDFADYNAVFRIVHTCILSTVAVVIILALIIQNWAWSMLGMVFTPAALVSAFCRFATVENDDAGGMAGILLSLAGGLAAVFYINAFVINVSKSVWVLPMILGVFLFSKFNSAQSRNVICALLCFAATILALWGASDVLDDIAGILIILGIVYGVSCVYLLFCDDHNSKTLQ